ncbi:UNVERIFIED_CONTAM: 60S ribosomal protein L21-1 [Sesamum radiatum]|uniref:60S ribosomal protein L21-1 n=1 Tax=Sesamum radiatum TaxID=300843 RepID=A0AAW2LCP3_SESRA
MPAGHGQRARTRDLFARPFRKKGPTHLSTYLRIYKIGDYVDVKVNGSIHKGMPHKFYHGRTGRVWNVTKRAIGVEVNKQFLFFFMDIENRTFGIDITLLKYCGSVGQNEALVMVGNRIIKKRIHVRVEHVQPSRCHEEILERIKKNDQLKAEAKAQGKIISTKRQPEGPKPGFMVEGATLETVTPIPYDVVNDLKGGY